MCAVVKPRIWTAAAAWENPVKESLVLFLLPTDDGSIAGVAAVGVAAAPLRQEVVVAMSSRIPSDRAGDGAE